MTVLFPTHNRAGAQSRAITAVLPIGSPLTIIADETVDPRVRPGSEFRAHLRDPLAVGDTLVATAGTPARLIVITKNISQDGSPNYRIGIVGLNLGSAGTLPVRPITPNVDHISAGMTVPASTLAVLGFEAGRIRVALPLPFTLSTDPPNGGYTAAPLRTAGPIITNRRRSRPTAAPSPDVTPSPPDVTPSPASASPSPASALPAPSPASASSAASPSPSPTPP